MTKGKINNGKLNIKMIGWRICLDKDVQQKIFCFKKSSHNSASVREITCFHSSMILPTLIRLKII